LSDNKARELFYAMDGAWRNIKSISTYLEKILLIILQAYSGN